MRIFLLYLYFCHFYINSMAWCDDLYDLKAAIEMRFGITNISMNIDFEEAQRQELRFPDTVSFKISVLCAFESFIDDDRDIESPLSIVYTLCEAENECGIDEEKEVLKKIINDPTSSIMLLSENDSYGLTDIPPPMRGEKVAENWLFLLRLPSLSDHTFWAIVPRNILKTYALSTICRRVYNQINDSRY